MSASDTIAAMGGKHEMSRLTGATPNAVTQWRRIGIPSRYWHVLVAEAERRGIEGITFETLAASKPVASDAAQDAA